jgi:hypothetical protein
MFAVTIVFGNTSWRLLYKDEKKAEEAYNFVKQPAHKTVSFNPDLRIELIDDFGQRAFFTTASINGGMLENLDESKLGAIEMALHQARTEIAGRQRAESDPTLRAASMNRGPAIVSPMGPNGRAFS